MVHHDEDSATFGTTYDPESAAAAVVVVPRTFPGGSLGFGTAGELQCESLEHARLLLEE